MDRRGFMAATGLGGLAAVGATQAQAQESSDGDSGSGREVYELRTYHFETEEQVAAFDTFMEEAAIPALNRIGIQNVGVFKDGKGKDISPVYVLLTHPNAESVVTMTQRIGEDYDFGADGADFLMAPAESPAYTRIESSLFLAFEGMPKMAIPSTAEGRVFQLRIYESPSVVTGQKKIEMFNTAEIDIFNKTGLDAVFFGEAIIGDKMPNLTYMLGFDSMKDQKAAWKAFIAHPEWEELSSRPEYADDKILSNITNIPLVPASYSQV